MTKVFTTIFLLLYMVTLPGAVTVQQICLHTIESAEQNSATCACAAEHEVISDISCCSKTDTSPLSDASELCSLGISSACCEEIAEFQQVETTLLTKTIEYVVPVDQAVLDLNIPSFIDSYPHQTVSCGSDPSWRINMPLLI